MSWWVLSSESLMEMLQRVAVGEDPGLIYAEYYANCRHEYEEGTSDGEGQEAT